MDRPETRYIAVGDGDVAYQAVGDGPFDLLYFYGLGSHVDLFWDIPEVAEFLKRLASFSRLLFFDRRGTGASDGLPRDAFPTWEEWTEDVGAVLDAAGSQQTAILASLDCGPIAMLYAALHPERVTALVLLNTASRFLVADDYPIGASPESVDALVALLGTMWGTPDLVRFISPTMADDPEYVRMTAKQLRAAATPRTAEAQYRYILGSVDVAKHSPRSKSRRWSFTSVTVRWFRSNTAASWPSTSPELPSSNSRVGTLESRPRAM